MHYTQTHVLYIINVLLCVYCILVPAPDVSVAALKQQTFSDSPLKLECNVTTVRGITSRVDILWLANGRIIRRINDSLSSLVNNSVLHRDVYDVSNVGDGVTEYQCHGVINGSPTVKGKTITVRV